MGPNKSFKTLWGGVIGAVGIAATGVAQMFEHGFDFAAMSAIVSAVGFVVMGIFARDDDVSSEGTKAVKAKKLA